MSTLPMNRLGRGKVALARRQRCGSGGGGGSKVIPCCASDHRFLTKARQCRHRKWLSEQIPMLRPLP
ncbi:MAG: hypothetical protein DI537_27200 [Stutzerimonas stutzeri]|nr:MAG: hypothetical protein DI537_27200 [Stutzerimonas stutzeri]